MGGFSAKEELLPSCPLVGNKHRTITAARDPGLVVASPPYVLELYYLISRLDGRSHTEEAPELANSDDHEGHVVAEGAVTPRRDAIKNCPFHLGQ